MSAGTKRYAFRLPDDLMEDAEVTIANRNMNSRETPWSLSDFIRIAIAEKIAKMSRGRKQQSNYRGGTVDDWHDAETNKLRLPDTDSEG